MTASSDRAECQALIGFKLSKNNIAQILAPQVRFVPGHGCLESLIKRPAWFPTKMLLGLRTVQFQDLTFVRMLVRVQRPAGPIAPQLYDPPNHGLYRFGVLLERTEIPCSCKFCPLLA